MAISTRASVTDASRPVSDGCRSGVPPVAAQTALDDQRLRVGLTRDAVVMLAEVFAVEV